MPVEVSRSLHGVLSSAGVANALVEVRQWGYGMEEYFYGLPAQLIRFATERFLAAVIGGR